eukprot:gene40193-64044_t
MDGSTANGDKRLLLQIFSQTLLGPVFFEFIQRKADEGFGEGNFKALFESLERDQIQRGALQAAAHSLTSDTLMHASRLKAGRLRGCGALLSVLLILAPAAAATSPNTPPAATQWVGRFEPSLAPWRELKLKSVERANTFRFVAWDGVPAVEVNSKASMSLLA